MRGSGGSFRDLSLSLLITSALFIIFTTPFAYAALSCSVTTTCNSPGVVLFRMSATSNAHAELSSQSNYTQLVCCTDGTGLSNSCSAGASAVVLRLAATTNSHVQENTLSTYTNNVCLAMNNGTVAVGYQANNCTGYDTTIASVAAATNSHVGDGSAYTTKVCGSSALPWLSFTVDSGTESFASLLPGGLSATSSLLYVGTNSFNGFNVTMNRSNSLATLINGSDASAYIPDKTNWSAPGATTTPGAATASTTEPFTLQFRVKKALTDTPNYADQWWGSDDTTPHAFFAGIPTTQQTIANRSTPAPTPSIIQVLYNAGVPASQETGTYSGDIVYSATVNL